MVSEGSGENIFLVVKGSIVTPSFCCSILPGITRNTVITMAKDVNIKVIEQPVPREALYIADEVFFTGSAAEITPITKIDGIQIGNGKVGPVTRELMCNFFAIVTGESEDRHDWLTYVRTAERVKR
jgi:branched-chain amino acid aminotransferase